MYKTGIIIQARLGSSRLPGKMLLPFFEDKGILQVLLENIITKIPDIPVVLATTLNVKDDGIEAIATHMGIPVFRGSEEDVLDRFIEAARRYSFKRIIRVCGDNPFLDMASLRDLAHLEASSDVDYVSYATKTNLPTIKTHYGFWAEMISLSALEAVQKLTDDKFYHEHITTYIFSNPDRFKIEFLGIPDEVDDLKLRMTVDTEEDFLLLKEIYSQYNNLDKTDLCGLVNFVASNKAWLQVMENQINQNTK